MNYDIESLKRKMLVKYPFFGSVVAGVSYMESRDISTAGTDGETIYYNQEFLEKLSVDEQTFIFAHEVCHIAFNHILRSEGKDQELWNIATDGVINQFLKRDGLKMVDGGVDIAEAINYDAEELYEKLLQEKKQNQEQCGCSGQCGNQSQSGQQCGNSGQSGDEQQQSQEQNSGQSGDEQQQSQEQNSGDGNSQQQDKDSQENNANGSGESTQDEEKKQQDAGHDTHSMWSDAVKKHKEQKEKEKEKKKKEATNGNQQKDKKENTDNKKIDNGKDNSQKKEKEKKQGEPKVISEKDAFKKNREEKKKNLEKLKDEITTAASKAGTTTNMDIRSVGDIGYAKPIIDWRYALREAIKYDVDWSYKNATIEEGVVTPHLEEQPLPETEIVIDTSGSINKTLLRSFLRECKNILKHSKLKVGCFDVKFYGFHEIRTEKDIDDMEFVGGGGTKFDVAVNAFSRRVENKIIFTDGEASMPEKAINAIWIVFGEEEINPKGGKVIMISNEQLARLNATTNIKRTLKK